MVVRITPPRTGGENGDAIVFAPCSFTGANKGDAALAHAMAAALADEIGAARLVMTSFTPEEDARRYGCEVLRMPVPPDGRVALRLDRLARRGPKWRRVVGLVVLGQVTTYLGVMRLWVALARSWPRLAGALLPRAQRLLVEAVQSAPVAAAVPGGYLMAPTRGHYHWLYHVPTLGLCSLLRRPIFLLPGSYGPFPGLHRRVAAEVLSRCELVMVREQASAEQVAAIGVPPERVRLVPDWGFLLPDSDGAAELDHQGLGWCVAAPSLIGVSVMQHDFPGSPDAAAAFEAYLRAVAGALDWCVERLGATPVLVNQVAWDAEASNAVVDRMGAAAQAVVIDADLSPFALKALYRNCELVLGTRAHANVLAMAAGVPAVAIAYEHKVKGIMEIAGLGRFVVSIESAGSLTAVVADAWEHREQSRRVLAEALPSLRAAAREGAVIVAAACRGDSGAHAPRPNQRSPA